ncbi:MAG TPA: PIF1 family ATP-dependent DNA helicase [Candidatus Omnitrophota bacterium]|nr:PIF1 family ATP-dependent DNA helicase [Candidatus Omnitrophota bacterium]
MATLTRKDIEFNDQFAKAYDLLENGNRNVFVTGKAGTGKSTLLQYFRAHTLKNVAVLAPTGVAAVNVQGQTIHSFFRFKPDITPEGVPAIKIRRAQKTLYQKIDTIVIDEISMVRADLLDCVDAFLRLHGRDRTAAFGGVQMIFIGDLYQLPPVVPPDERDIFGGVYPSPYFFDSKAFSEVNSAGGHPYKFVVIELKKIYRQKEEDFVRLLGMIRNRTITAEHLEALNKRYLPHFKPKKDDLYVYLTTTNAMADRINQEKLDELPSQSCFSEGVVAGDFVSRNLPTHQSLELKVGAQVMLLNNDPGGRWVNGSIGKITNIVDGGKIVIVELTDGQTVEVAPFEWEMFRFFFNEGTQKLESESVGSFKQHPLKPAWAVTIHKSQGKTFDKAIVDVGTGTFAHGQAYVALSRCASFGGLVLKKPILRRHILLDNSVVRFMSSQLSAEN